MVKNRNIIFLIIPIFLLACSIADNKKDSSVIYFESGYSLHQDTIHVDIKGEMTHALKYHDKFYVLFKQRVLKYGGYGKRWLYIFSNGQLERIIDCPKEMRTVYLDFYAKNDSLILKPYMDKQSYYFDLTNYRWTKIDKTDDLIFEDEKFQVYSLDFGEWGGKTWFKEKKTGQEYVLEATTPLVNKIDSTYYLTNSFRVLKIENPRLLNECSDDITYENIESSGKSYSWYGEPIGFDIVYQDTTIDYFDFNYKPHIVSSFVLDKDLLHIYETDTATYIARHKRNSIEPIQKIADNISFYNWHYSYRCSNFNGNNELLKFRTKNEQTFGLLEMIDQEIHVTYFKNKALLEPILVGAEKADSIFVNRLNHILPKFRNLEISTLDSKEQTWGSFDISPNHHISVGNNWNPNNYTIDTCRSYLVKEDSIFSNSIMYYGTKDSNLVRVVSIDWDYERNLMKSDSEKHAKKTFDNKTEFLIDYISGNIGKQIEKSDEKDFIRRTWVTPAGIKLYLSYNRKYYGIRLVIYEK
ncbi:MAG: hypothetical protein K0B10_06545 [Vicingaceae bacterium]|nr:hypothetical protein [Vicingaceae bacterium]